MGNIDRDIAVSRLVSDGLFSGRGSKFSGSRCSSSLVVEEIELSPTSSEERSIGLYSPVD